MKIRPLTVGPIVGATTGSQVRLWGRGELEKTNSGPRRCFGVARLRRSGGRFGRAKFFKMNPNFDMSVVVVSSVPVFPQVRSDNQDKWGGFTRQRSELLDFIRDNDIRRVVFLSGDVHSSLSAELVSPGATPGWKIISIISSAFFWPYPHNRRREFIMDGEISSIYSDEVYRVTNGSQVTATDNFSRLTVDLESVEVEVYSRKGELLTSRTHAF